MELHRNAKLGLSGRFALVQAREQGLSVREVARRFSVSPATVSRWSRRWQAASEQERCSLVCLCDRSSRPRRMPRLVPSREQRRICAARRQSGWGPRLLTLRTGHPHSTISKVLKRNGLSRPPRAVREPERRYEWPCPGDLLHMDVTLYARFERPGHAVTGDRRSTAAEKRAKVGYDYAHAIVDDHSRLAYAELLDDERAATVTAFVERALAVFAAHGIEAKRLMTDNAWAYTKNGSLRELLSKRGVRHLTTRPRRPRTNGKVERFHQTMAREWAYGLRYRSSRHRAAALPHWLRYYNQRRPHSSLGGLPPISRVHNVCGQDS
ncbi:MAG: IS481 family transposase [Actinomycetota bacterium]|nr:IS481 family transposase [Actinomycetota bacterium]